MKRLWLGLGVSVLVASGLVGYGVGRARAYGIPQTGTMAYSGSLLSFGQPDNNTHMMSVSLYVTEADGGTGTAACSSTTQSVTTVNGQFTVQLSEPCVTVIHQNSNVQVQVTIDTVPMGLTALSAVPYTVEADTASNPAPGSVLSQLVPTGTVLDFAGPTPPAGFLACDGSAVSRTTYGTLFGVISTTFGAGDGVSTFNVPDSRSRVTMGAGSGVGLTARTLGQTFGEENHVLAVSEIPAHQHVTATNTPNNAGGSIYGSIALQNPNTMWGSTNGNANYVQETSSTGGGAGHNTIPPTIVFTRIIKD